jgi:hypothetical protein
MAIVDTLLDLLFQHSYTLQPGYIIENFGQNKIRNVFLLESSISAIENEIIQNGQSEFAYDYGKKFGYNYSSIISLPEANRFTRDEVFKSLMRFFESTYGHCEKYTINWEKKEFSIIGNNIIVCRKNGKGNILFEGAWAGVISYLIKDQKIEGKKKSCEGKGDKFCEGVFGYREAISSEFSYSDIPPRKLSQNYFTFNQVIPFENNYGLNILRDIGIMKYQTNTFEMFKERFFPIEVGFIHQLEFDLQKKNLDGKKLVYSPTYKSFFTYGKNNFDQKHSKINDAADFVSKLFTALGWGICTYQPIPKPTIVVRGFPFTDEMTELKSSNYFNAALCGFIGGLINENIEADLSIASIGPSFDFTLVLKKVSN